MTGRICVAQIGAPHGVRGEVRLRSFTEDPLAFTEYGPLESEDGRQRFEIEALRPAKDHFVARLSGVADRNAAEKLTNFHHEQLADPGSNTLCGTWYLAKLLRRYSATDDAVPFALADYNAGRGHVLRWNGGVAATNSAQFLAQMTFPGTRRYIETIRERREKYRDEFAPPR